ncbi:hypothetical protein CPJCM30710_21170 [Clostridium polyendosporum]|uniref:HesB-like selenoprotein n=1 Tax=Clostridium polyendosporum TaxID=69208 RepID=A0A919S007_9CLOT|nr:hypothetical protein [Clostridium polyendosporum]GIM29451.1 hypothetical protein CPJCM30710_21170 [Clostridium polyendosporum]
MTFYVDQQLINDYEGFVILSTEENNGKGMALKPSIDLGGGGCSTCSSCD